MYCNGFVFMSVLYAFASTKNLFKYLRARYCHQVVQELNYVIKLKGKCVRHKESRVFLQKCLDLRVAPSNIKERVSKIRPKDPAGIERAFIKDELAKAEEFFGQASERYRTKLLPACKELSLLDRLRFCKLLTLTSERLRQQTLTKNDRTLRWLLQSQIGQGVLRHSTIVNLADVELSDIEKDVLCRGLDFGIPPHLSRLDIEAEFELGWQQLGDKPTSEERRKECKATLAGIAQRYAGAKIDSTGYPLNRQHHEAIKKLKRNKDIVISRPDKGKGVVIMNRSDYIEKMSGILSQENKFQLIGDAETHDRTIQAERALQAFLLRAKKAGDLPNEVYERIRPVGTARPRMYGVPKIHKSGTPLRPILSMINAPQHELAKWLTDVLKPVVGKFSTHTVKDTFEFCENIQNYSAENDANNAFMCSFDITSLFTNIPLEATIKICLDTLYRDPETAPPSIPEQLLHKLLLKATTEVEFSFDGVMYRQIDGVAMGSPLGPILANIFVGHSEAQLQEDLWPPFYNRFVDDTFAIFQSEERSQQFHTALNKIHPALRFTVERESNCQLPFMDVLVQRTNELVRSVYRKPTFTGLYTRWDSFAPTSQKIALIKSLASRARKICSPCMLPQEVVKLKTIFQENGYPTHIVDRVIKQTIYSPARTHGLPTDSQADPPKEVYFRLPWIGHQSTNFRKEITRAIDKGFFHVNTRVIFTTNRAFAGRAKDILPTTSLSSVVYEYTCRCERAYVGRTSQCLSERIKQHVPATLLQARPVLRKAKSDSAVARHLKENPACLQGGDDVRKRFRVLARARHLSHLSVLEAVHIRDKTPDLCKQKDFVRVLHLV